MIRNIKKMFILFSILSITPFMRGCSPEITFGFPFPIIKVPTDIPEDVFGPFPFDYQSELFFRRYSLYSYYSYNGTQNILVHITALMLNFLIIYLLVKRFVIKEKNTEKTTLFLYALFVNLCCAWSILFKYLKFIHIYYIWYVPLFIVTRIFNLMARLGLYNLYFSDQILEISMDILIRIWFIIITVLLAILFYFLKKIKTSK